MADVREVQRMLRRIAINAIAGKRALDHDHRNPVTLGEILITVRTIRNVCRDIETAITTTRQETRTNV